MIVEIESPGSVYLNKDLLHDAWGFTFENLRDSLSHFSGPAQMKNWMHFGIHGYVLADTYQRPVVLFSKSGSCTYLPLSHPPTDNPPLCFIMITERSHLITFNFKAELWAAPPLDPTWKWHAKKDAKPWDKKIKPHLDHARLAMPTPPTRRSARNQVIEVESASDAE